MISKLIRNPVLRILSLGIITTIGFIASLPDFFDLVLQFIPLRMSLILLFSLLGILLIGGLAYHHYSQKSKGKIGKGTYPEIEDLENETLLIAKLSHLNEIADITRLATDYFKEDAMPYELILELHWHSRDTVYLLKHHKHGVIGYLALFFPTPEMKSKIFEGTVAPMEWTNRDFIATEDAWKLGYIYLESTVVCMPDQTENFLFLLTEVLEDAQRHLFSVGMGSVELFGLAGTDDGRNLMRRRLGLRPVNFAWERKDEMDLYAGSITIAGLTELRRFIELKKHEIMSRKKNMP